MDRQATLSPNPAHAAGPTLVLLHGAGGNEFSFEELQAALPGVPTVAPSLPGRCDVPGPPLLDMGESARWLGAWLTERGIERPVLCGHSAGGALALESAVLGTVVGLRGLILMCTGGRLRVHPAIMGVMAMSARSGQAAPSPPGLFTDAELGLRLAVARRGALTPPASTLADWRRASAFDRMDALSSLDCPTLVISGDHDALTPHKYSQYLADHIPGARLQTLVGAGHMLPVERPDELADRIREFLQELSV